jgi:hypothetical protein
VTVPLAVDWNAVSAVAAAGVLAWAVWEHGQAARQRRNRDLALLRALIVVTRGAEKILRRRRAEATEQGLPAAKVAQALLFTRGLEISMRALEGVSLLDLPTANAVDALLAARAGVENALAAAELIAAEQAPIEALDAGIAALFKAAEKFDSERTKLRPLIDKLRRKPVESIA